MNDTIQQPPQWNTPAVLLATGFWIGRVPLMPGTFGTLLGLPLAFAIAMLDQPWLQLVVIAVLLFVSVPICTRAVGDLGGRKDPGAIVLDEVIALPITFLFVPFEDFEQLWVLPAGFVLFRLFDITKPPPARRLEHLPDGWGIMADDVAAGVYSCLALHGVLWAMAG